MTDIAQVRETKASHLVDKDGVGRPTPTGSPLAGDIHDRDIFYAGSYGIPCLPKGDPSQNDGIAGHRARVIVREVIVTHSDSISLDARRNVKVGVRHHFGLAPRMNQEARMTIPLNEIVTQRRFLAGVNLNQLSALFEKMDQGGIADCLCDTAQ